MACITNKLANPSIKVNAGVLFDKVQSQGFKRILCVHVEGVEFVVKAFRTITRIERIMKF
jgi:hypothetical protein